MNKMKILYLANAKSIHTKRWVEYFTQRGHEIHVISFIDADITNVKIHLLKRSGGQIKFISYIMDSIYSFYQIKKLLKKIRPDIIHAHYVWDYGVSGILLGFHPILISVWGSDVLVVPKKSSIYKLIIGKSLRRADIVTTTAKFMASYLQKEFNLSTEKIKRIPWGVDLNIFHKEYRNEVEILREELNIQKGSFVIISNRHLHPLYNISSIVEAAYHVVQAHPSTIFIILKGYGSLIYENEMKKKTEELGISKNFRFISNILIPKEMAVFLNASDMFISIPNTDQFASSVMEGMACGLIPIVSNIESYQQYLNDSENAFFVNPDNVEEIAKKIINCINNSSIKKEIQEINRAIIEKEEDWNINSRKMEELYRNLMEKKNEMENSFV